MDYNEHKALEEALSAIKEELLIDLAESVLDSNKTSVLQEESNKSI